MPNPHRCAGEGESGKLDSYAGDGNGDVWNEIPTRGMGTGDQIPIVVLGHGLYPHLGAVDGDLDGGQGPNPHRGSGDE